MEIAASLEAEVDLERTLERATPDARQWRAWTVGEPALAGARYADIRAELREGTTQRKDTILGALVRTVQEDPTAFGVLAAVLLPGLRRRVGRYASCLDRQEAFAIAVIALYEAVSGYDTDARPRFVAGRLLAAPERRLRRAAARPAGTPSPADREVEPADPRAIVDLTGGAVLQHAVDARVLTFDEATLIAETRLAGRPLREAGDRLGLGYEATKKRRQRAEARWVAWWVPDLATASHERRRGVA